MTRDEILAEFEQLLATSADPEGYLTAEDMAEMLGITKPSLHKRLRVARLMGRLSVIKVKRPSNDGRLMDAPAYRILPDTKVCEPR